MNSFAYGVYGNDVVGQFEDSSGYHGFLYDGSGYTTLDDPLATEGTEAHGIFGNDIVGDYQNASGAHGFLYNGSGFETLDDPLGAEGTDVSGISGNSVGGFYIDASGDEHGFIATVVPEPSTLGLLGVVTVVLAVYRQRKPFGPPAHNWVAAK